MSRILRRSVVSGGVVYPAGAAVPDEVAERITADVFEPEAPKPAAKKAASKAKGKG